MKIRNKIESHNKIIELNLNRFPEKIFKSLEINLINDFIKKYPAQYYAIRDKSKVGGIFKLKVKPENLFQEVNGYDLFSINVSSYNYIKNQILVGEIFINNFEVNAILSTNKGYSVRDALRNPDFNFSTKLTDDKTLNKIPSFDKIYKYIFEHNLENVIVEFAWFDIPLGVNQEQIIIYELRTDY